MWLSLPLLQTPGWPGACWPSSSGQASALREGRGAGQQGSEAGREQPGMLTFHKSFPGPGQSFVLICHAESQRFQPDGGLRGRHGSGEGAERGDDLEESACGLGGVLAPSIPVLKALSQDTPQPPPGRAGVQPGLVSLRGRRDQLVVLVGG